MKVHSWIQETLKRSESGGKSASQSWTSGLVSGFASPGDPLSPKSQIPWVMVVTVMKGDLLGVEGQTRASWGALSLNPSHTLELCQGVH